MSSTTSVVLDQDLPTEKNNLFQFPNEAKEKFVKRKYFNSALRLVGTLREDDLGPKLKFSDEAKDVLYQYMYDYMSKLFHCSGEMKKHLMSEKSGKKLTGQDILLAMKSDTIQYGFMDPSVFMEKSHYTSVLIFLETLMCLMSPPTKFDKSEGNKMKEEEEEKEEEESDESNGDDEELEIMETGFYFKRFGLEVDYSKGVFDYQVDCHINSKSQKREMPRMIFPTWYNKEDFAKLSEKGSKNKDSDENPKTKSEEEGNSNMQESKTDRHVLLIGDDVQMSDIDDE